MIGDYFLIRKILRRHLKMFVNITEVIENNKEKNIGFDN